MADFQNNIQTTLTLDVTEAQQEIIRLNSIASNSTKTLEERLKAKNKVVEIQNNLSKKTLDDLEDEIKLLQGIGASEKDIEKVKKKLNSERIKATRLAENNAKAQSKLAQSYADSTDNMKLLDKGTGGLITKFNLLVANPIVAIMSALVGAFKLVTEALRSTEDGAAALNAVTAAIGQIFTNLITLLSKALTPVIEFIAKFFTKNLNPVFEKFSGFVDAGKLALQGFLDFVKLLLTPLRALIATAQAAAKAIKGDFDGAKQVMSDFKDSTVDTAKSMADNFTQSGQKVVETVKEIGVAFEEAEEKAGGLLAEAANIELAQNKLNKAKRAQQLLDAKLNTQAAEALALSKNYEASFEDRIKALDEYGALRARQNKNEVSILDQEIALLERRRALGGNTQEDEEAYNQLLIQRENLNATLADREREFFEQKKTLLAEQKAAEDRIIAEQKKAEADRLKKLEEERKRAAEIAARDYEAQLEIDALDIERRRAQGEQVLELELELLERKREQELSNTELTETERLAIIERYKMAEENLINSTLKAKLETDKKAKESAISSAAEAFGISKEVALAQMLMAAPQAIGHSFKKASETYPFPLSLAMGAAGATGTVAPIIKSVKEIRETKVKGISGGGSKGGGGGTVNSTPTSVVVTDVSANNAARLGIDPSLSGKSSMEASANIQGGSSPDIVFSEDKYNSFKEEVSFKEDKTTF